MIKQDIVDYVTKLVLLKKKGKDYWCKCPFHLEDTPSFSVSSEKQMYFCFGCKAGGDIIDFIQRYHKTDFFGALNILGIKKPETKREKRQAAIEIRNNNHQKRINQLWIEHFDAIDEWRHWRIARVDGLIEITKEAMGLCKCMEDIEKISCAVDMLTEWKYELDCLLFDNDIEDWYANKN
jgi:hypothetical protein